MKKLNEILAELYYFHVTCMTNCTVSRWAWSVAVSSVVAAVWSQRFGCQFLVYSVVLETVAERCDTWCIVATSLSVSVSTGNTRPSLLRWQVQRMCCHRLSAFYIDGCRGNIKLKLFKLRLVGGNIQVAYQIMLDRNVTFSWRPRFLQFFYL